MKVSDLISLTILVWIVALCLPALGAGRSFSLDQFDKVKGESSKADVLSIFGKPARKARTVGAENPQWEVWDYHQAFVVDGLKEESFRMTFFFEAHSGRLITRTFHIDESDKVSSVDQIKKRYGANQLKLMAPRNCYHGAPSGREYSDESKGLTVSTSGDGKGVGSLSWSQPEGKKPASGSKDCGPSIPAEEIQ